MRCVIQRVKQASVTVDEAVVGEINQGLLALVAIEKGDEPSQADALLAKMLNYRVFADEQDKMNLSLKDVQGGLLLVSQFTLAASTKKGLRPSFSGSAQPDHARVIFDHLLTQAKAQHFNVSNGIFAADMQVTLVNDGPVTFILES